MGGGGLTGSTKERMYEKSLKLLFDMSQRKQ